MARFTFEAGMLTLTFSVACALRMRVSMSAMGSLMLISCLLPARLDHPGDLATHGDLADLVAREPELAERAAGTTRHGAAVAKAHGGSVAPQRLQLRARLLLRVVGRLRILDDRQKLLAALREFLHGRAALGLSVDDGKLGH